MLSAMRTPSLALVAPLLSLLSACATHRPYPVAAWGPLPAPPAEDCRHFEGSYGDRGEPIPGAKQQPSLSSELFFEDYSPDNEKLARATRVSFSLPTDDVLDVTVWEGATPLLVRSLKRPKNFECEAGRLVIRRSGLVTANMGFGWGSVAFTFHSTDDYLVGQRKDSEAGVVFLVVPMKGSGTTWYRFARER